MISDIPLNFDGPMSLHSLNRSFIMVNGVVAEIEKQLTTPLFKGLENIESVGKAAYEASLARAVLYSVFAGTTKFKDSLKCQTYLRQVINRGKAA